MITTFPMKARAFEHCSLGTSECKRLMRVATSGASFAEQGPFVPFEETHLKLAQKVL